MEASYDFETDENPETVKEYLINPRNLIKYVPNFKDLKETEDGWELYVHWLFTIKLKIIRIVSNDEISYLIKKSEGMIKLNANLRFIILPTKNITKVKLVFFYQGPFESFAKRQADEFYKRGAKIFQEDLKKKTVVQTNEGSEVPLYAMRTILAKKVQKQEIESILEDAMVKSVDKLIVLILSDGKNTVELTFNKGDVTSQKGDVNSLKGEITVIMKAP
ncbi:STK_08120 family protein [Acidianus sp. HS-5]|uniref:STK_08120 family protein n=1 Tax=Acidianus sp. HS-5 TaxID=2886040 RepID=UPI001F27E66D|nr:STK_08120 family protein [Acidianus sp. HS-5]BDC17293.1 hypothetical protein HS5_01830 [Acidianus sp. HS-5]